ncbi:MFS transporter [Companilactobacillus sp. HBUAS56257]|uniref:MFS transporter n=1 Tax=Companilactobacillus sp. HBUAS56257 TaxID=3109360 RepID=UPI002FF09E39
MNKLKIRIGILSMALLTMSALVITSAFSAIIRSFPKESVAKIQMIGTLPSLGTVIATFLVSFLAVHMSKKVLGLIGVTLSALGGLLPLAFHSSVNVLLMCALLLGLGLGFINPIIPMLISMFFDGDDRAEMMGQNTAINSLGSIILMLLGGFLGANNWVHTYYAFFITIIVFLLVLFFLPKDKVVKMDNNKQVNTLHLLGGLNKYVFYASIIGLFMSIIYTIYPTNLSIIVDSKQLGGTSITGIVNAVGTIGGFIAGFSMKKINHAVKDKALPVGFFLLALTFLLVRIANNIVIVLIGAILSGFAMAIVMSTIPFYVSLVSKPIELAVSMSVFQFLNALGGIFTPLILSWFNIQSGNDAFTFGIIASFVMMVVCLFFNIGKKILPSSKKKQIQRSSQVVS